MGKTTDGIIEATAAYEQWLRGFGPLNEDDLKAKHDAMAADAFPFLRATFYRWTQIWPQVCADLAGAPAVLAIGDLHVENFGTWRDAEGRLTWGVNDFDDAFPLPYTNDLVRLATSTLLAVDDDHLSVDGKAACEAIVRGYTQGLESGGRPFVIDEENQWFLPLFARKAKAGDPSNFWSHLRESLKSDGSGRVPPEAAAALTARLPLGSEEVSMLSRQAGVGSLGKPRFVGLARWLGGPVAREIKALTPSACVWSEEGGTPAASAPAHSSRIQELLQRLTQQGLRCPDPFFHVDGGWISRRLACDSRKIELKASADEPDALRLLEAMGRETANVHLGVTSAVTSVRNDLAARSHKWLYSAATAMQDVTHQEQKAWARQR